MQLELKEWSFYINANLSFKFLIATKLKYYELLAAIHSSTVTVISLGSYQQHDRIGYMWSTSRPWTWPGWSGTVTGEHDRIVKSWPWHYFTKLCMSFIDPAAIEASQLIALDKSPRWKTYWHWWDSMQNSQQSHSFCHQMWHYRNSRQLVALCGPWIWMQGCYSFNAHHLSRSNNWSLITDWYLQCPKLKS